MGKTLDILLKLLQVEDLHPLSPFTIKDIKNKTKLYDSWNPSRFLLLSSKPQKRKQLSQPNPIHKFCPNYLTFSIQPRFLFSYTIMLLCSFFKKKNA